jgi:hypothetical protein
MPACATRGRRRQRNSRPGQGQVQRIGKGCLSISSWLAGLKSVLWLAGACPCSALIKKEIAITAEQPEKASYCKRE